jgi:hypothetical protein
VCSSCGYYAGKAVVVKKAADEAADTTASE